MKSISERIQTFSMYVAFGVAFWFACKTEGIEKTTYDLIHGFSEDDHNHFKRFLSFFPKKYRAAYDKVMLLQ